MSLRLSCIFLAAACISAAPVFGAAAAPAQPIAMTPRVVPDPNEVIGPIRIPDADIDTIIRTLEAMTGRNVIRPPTLPAGSQGPFNVWIDQPIPRQRVIDAIYTALKLGNVGVIESGEEFLILTQLNLIRTEAPEMIAGSTLGLPPSGRIATKFFKPNFINAQQFFAGIGGTLLSQQVVGANVVQMTAANAAIVTDTISNLQRVESLLAEMDKPVTPPKFYPLRAATAQTIVQSINQTIQPYRQSFGQTFTIVADARTNQVMLVAHPDVHPFFDALIEKLDVRADPNTNNEVIYLKHAQADQVATLLSNLVDGQSTNTTSIRPGQGAAGANQPQQPGQPQGQQQQPQVQPFNQQQVIGPGGVPINQPAAQVAGAAAPGAAPGAPGIPAAPALPGAGAVIPFNALTIPGGVPGTEGSTNQFSASLTIQDDARTNSIIVSGTADDVRLIKMLVDKIDIVLAQVRIEVVIAEVTLDDNHSSGISALGLVVDGDRLVGFSGEAAGLSVANGVVTRPGVVGPGRLDLAAEISLVATPRKNNTTILSIPAIVTSHGNPAEIFNGETRPVVTGTTTNNAGNPQSTITPQEIGTTLTFTPLIANDGTVELDIQQNLTDVIGEVLIDGNTQYIIGQKSTDSYITARSGEIIVLGSFQKQIDSKSSSRLGPIPFIGDLLGSRTNNKRRQEVIFFLRPTILTNTTADNVTTLKHLSTLPMGPTILQKIDPTYVPPPAPEMPRPTTTDRILRK